MLAQPAPATSRFGAALLDAPDKRLFASDDLEHTRAEVGRVMKPHRLDVAGRAQRLDARMHHVAFGNVALSRLKYGADVCIEPGPLGDFYLVQMPLAGSAWIRSGAQQVDSTPEVASVLSPSAATTMRWAADNDQIMLRIARPLVERALRTQLGAAPGRAPEFELAFRWRECAAWSCLMAYLLDCGAHAIDFARHPLLADHVEQLVATTLLSVQPHDLAEAKRPRESAILPRHVRRAQEYLQAHAHEPVTPDTLAREIGVSPRSLYAGFQQGCGLGPMQYLKALRLDRARADLQSEPASAASVASVAFAWGFGHLGRFSADYKARFGESPSETLRRR